jgi:uncharacterized protein YcbK (DUF882 family)
MIGRRNLIWAAFVAFWGYKLEAASIGFTQPFIGADDILKGGYKKYRLSKKQRTNLNNLLIALNKFIGKYKKPLKISSGYRTHRHNRRVGGADDSTHLHCMAVDFLDPKRKLAKWCMANLDVLEECGLWIEHPKHTPGWVHLDIRPRNIRVFHP